MEGIETEVSLADAVGFLTTRAEEARRDSVHITDAEIKQLSFTEETATKEEIAAARAFDDANDTDEFEAKISKLLRHAFDQDVKRGMRSLWQKRHAVWVEYSVSQVAVMPPTTATGLQADSGRTRSTQESRRRLDQAMKGHVAHRGKPQAAGTDAQQRSDRSDSERHT